MIETFHLKLAHVKEFHRGECMLYGYVVTVLVDIVRHKPKMKSHGQDWEIVNLRVSVDVPSPKVKFMHLCVVKRRHLPKIEVSFSLPIINGAISDIWPLC